MIIVRYLSKEVIQTLLAVTIILLLAILSQQVVRYLNYIAIGRIPTNVLMQLVSFEAPYILSFLLPLGLYLGILLVYGRMHSEQEMAILELYGYNQSRLMKLTIVMSIGVSLIVLILTLWVNPFLSAKRQQLMTSDEATLHLVQTLIPGRFQVSPDGQHVMYVEKLSRDHKQAKNVFLAQEKKIKNSNNQDQLSWMLVLSSLGYQAKLNHTIDPAFPIAGSAEYFITEDGNRYEGIPGQNDFKMIQFKKYAIRIPETNATILHEDNQSLSLQQLWKDYATPKKAAEFQWRFSLAIIPLLLAIIAIPLSRIRPRQNRYVSLIPAVLIYILYINLLYIARHWFEHGILPFSLGIWWVHGVMLFIIGMLFLKNHYVLYS